MRTFRGVPVLAAISAFTLCISPASAQGMAEMGAAYGMSATTAAGASHGAAAHRGAVGGLFNSSAGALNAIHSGNGSASSSSGTKEETSDQPKVDPVTGETIMPDPRVTVKNAGKKSNDFFKLAQQKEKAGKLDEAVTNYYKSLSIRAKIWGDKDPAVLQMYGLVANILIRQHKGAQAETFMRRKLQQELKVYGFGSYDLMPTLEGLGDALQAQGKCTDAANYYKQVVTMRQRKLGDDNKQTVLAAYKLAQAYAGAERDYWPDAEDLLKKNITIVEKVPEDAPELAKLLEAYSSLMRKENKTDEADKLSMRAQQVRATFAPPQAPVEKAADKADEATKQAAETPAPKAGETATKPGDTKPTETKTVETKTVETKSTETKSTETAVSPVTPPADKAK